jgi:hypothetical protein
MGQDDDLVLIFTLIIIFVVICACCEKYCEMMCKRKNAPGLLDYEKFIKLTSV